MESYEQAVDLALMVVNLEKSVYKTMIIGGLKQYLNSQYPNIARSNNSHELNKFVLASKILLNDLQAIPVNSCRNRNSTSNSNSNRGANELCSNCEKNKCDEEINYQTPIFSEALINPPNVVNSNVTRYIGGYNPNTFNPQISRLSQPLDTIGLYQNKFHNPMTNFNNSVRGYGPESKVRLEEHSRNPTTHPVSDSKNTLYSQYSSVYVNDNGE